MEASKYTLLETELVKTALDIARRKRPAYTGESKDVLHNFKQSGNRAGITAKQAWIVLASKHFDALCSFAKNPKTPQAESLASRAADLINYTILLFALAVDEGDVDFDYGRDASPYSKEGGMTYETTPKP